MVRREGSRFGVCTGHSMRRSAYTQRNIHSSQNIVVTATADVKLKRAQGQAAALLESHLQERMLSAKSVKGFENEITLAFSLNKSKRWESMNTLKKEVGYSCCRGNRIIVAEHHMGVGHLGECDCIGVYDSRCEKSRRLPRKMYAKASDLVAKDMEDGGECVEDEEFGTKNRSRRQRKKVKVDKKTGVQIEAVTVDVSYSVNVAAPLQTRLTYPKHGVQASNAIIDQDDDGDVVVQSLKRGTKKRNKKPSRDLWEDIHAEDVWEDDHVEDVDDDQWMENEEAGIYLSASRSRLTRDLGMFIVSPKSAYQALQGRRRISGDSELARGSHKKGTKDQVVTIDAEQSSYDDSAAMNDKHEQEEEEDVEFRRCFRAQKLAPEYLWGVFGDSYQEARSAPRRFAIDVTSRVVSYVSGVKMGREMLGNCNVEREATDILKYYISETSLSMSKTQPVYMMFSLEEEEEGADLVCASIKVVGGNPHLLEIPENVFELAVMDPSHKEDSITEADEITSSDSCSDETTTPAPWSENRVFVCPLNTTKRSLQWEYGIQTLAQLGQEIFKGTSGGRCKGGNTDRENFGAVNLCGICCEVIDDEQRGTALLACNHWFCSECWRGYLKARIGQGNPDVKCPEFNCDSEVDPVTLMSLVPSKFFNLHWKQKVNSAVARQKDILRCPSPGCENLVRMGVAEEEARPPNGTAILCSCHFLWCTECREEAHWPATCTQADVYRKEKAHNLRNVAANDVLVDFVRYKCCPRCGNPIQKISGCNVMSCPCKCIFCWNCGVEWSEHGPTYACPEKQVLHQEYEFTDAAPLRHIYEVAVEHHFRWSKSSSARRLHNAMDLANVVAIAVFSRKTDHSDCQQNLNRAATLTYLKQEGSLLMQLKHIMWEADQFLLEADFILEHTEVFLGGLPSCELKRALVQQKNRLAFVVQQLDSIMNKRLAVDKLGCRERIEALCRNGKSCLAWLVKGAAKLREKLSTTMPVE